MARAVELAKSLNMQGSKRYYELLLGLGVSTGHKDRQQAIAYLTEVFEGRLRLLGPDDVHTIAARYLLACAQKNAGNNVAAKSGFEEALKYENKADNPKLPL